MGKEANIETSKKMGDIVNKHDFNRLREVFADDAKDHDPAPDQKKGAEGFVGFFTEFQHSFPDLKISPETMLADDDKVALAYTMTGTQDGPFMGIPATGKKVKVRGLQIARFNDDAKIVERWGSSDTAGILQQIGALAKADHVDERAVITDPASTGKI